MTDEQLELAQQLWPLLIEHHGWVPGLQLVSPHSEPWRPHDIADYSIIRMEHRGGWDLDLSDYATAAILLRMAMEASSTSEARSIKGYIHIWFNYTNLGVFKDRDLGTAAAKALLAVWAKEK